MFFLSILHIFLKCNVISHANPRFFDVRNSTNPSCTSLFPGNQCLYLLTSASPKETKIREKKEEGRLSSSVDYDDSILYEIGHSWQSIELKETHED